MTLGAARGMGKFHSTYKIKLSIEPRGKSMYLSSGGMGELDRIKLDIKKRTGKIQNDAKGVDTGQPANLPNGVRWIDDTPSMGQIARDYEDGVTGAMSNLATRRRQVPVINRTLADGTKAPVKFDGIDGNTLIDRKVSITTFSKSKNQALRQSQALQENGLTGLWEVPNEAQAKRARAMLEQLKIFNIEVRIAP